MSKRLLTGLFCVEAPLQWWHSYHHTVGGGVGIIRRGTLQLLQRHHFDAYLQHQHAGYYCY
jgi:hypothetical protein